MNNKRRIKRKVILHNLIKKVILLFMIRFFFLSGTNRIQVYDRRKKHVEIFLIPGIIN